MRYTLLDTSGERLKNALNAVQKKQQIDLTGSYNATTRLVTLSASVDYDFLSQY